MAPNLFNYATKELSQDAFIAWLLAWSDGTCEADDPSLHAAGRSLVCTLLEMHNVPCPQFDTVIVHQQLLRADIVAEVGADHVILIEDKIHAGLNGDQLKIYLEKIKKKFYNQAVLPIFLKTGDQSNYNKVEESKYKLLLRSQILDLLRPWRGRTANAIFCDFLANLERREAAVESYRTKPVSEWTQEREPWIGFYKKLQDYIDGIEWDDVSNPAGGFLGAWWGRWGWRDPNTGTEYWVYLQIEQGPLCFKIEVKDHPEADKRDLRDLWHARVITVANELGFTVNRPSKMGLGTWMTVARTELNDWMASDSAGFIDLTRTLTKLHDAARVVARAAGE